MWSDHILSSLEIFHQLYGHCRISQSFVVPSASPWPKKAWGWNLGVAVETLRSRKAYSAQVARDAARLEKIDFVWNFNEHQWSERILPSLETFHRLNGHCRVPQSFVVPSTAQWPQKAWGLNLGVTVNNVRVHRYFPELTKRDRGRLDVIEFSWDVVQDKWEQVVLPVLETFHQINGHSSVPQSFVVPETLEWPEATWGIKLGITISNIRNRGDFAEQRKQDQSRLDAIGFDTLGD